MKFDTKPFEEKMSKTIATLTENFATIRAGQANAGVLARVMVDYYGSPTPMSDLANIRAIDARTLTVAPYDRSTLKAMEKAILAANIGITPNNDGTVIRLCFPQMTEENRMEIKKKIQKMTEEAKVAIRNIRRDANDETKKQKKDGILTEDDVKTAEKNVQDLTDKYIKKLDEVAAKKEKEIMQI